MLEINTRDLKNRKRVRIDGHDYVVRRMGAGEELQMSQIMRELERMKKKAESNKELSESELNRADELATKIFAITYGTFDDGGDGSKSKALLESLSNEDMAQMQKMIFNNESNVDIEGNPLSSEAVDTAGEAAEDARDTTPTES